MHVLPLKSSHKQQQATTSATNKQQQAPTTTVDMAEDSFSEEYPKEFHARGEELYDVAQNKEQQRSKKKPTEEQKALITLKDILDCLMYNERIRKNEQNNPGTEVSSVPRWRWERALKAAAVHCPYEITCQWLQSFMAHLGLSDQTIDISGGECFRTMLPKENQQKILESYWNRKNRLETESTDNGVKIVENEQQIFDSILSNSRTLNWDRSVSEVNYSLFRQTSSTSISSTSPSQTSIPTSINSGQFSNTSFLSTPSGSSTLIDFVGINHNTVQKELQLLLRLSDELYESMTKKNKDNSTTFCYPEERDRSFPEHPKYNPSEHLTIIKQALKSPETDEQKTLQVLWLNSITLINYALLLNSPVRLLQEIKPVQHYVKAIEISQLSQLAIEKLVASDSETDTGLVAKKIEMEVTSFWITARSQELLSIATASPPTNEIKANYQKALNKLDEWPESERTKKGSLFSEEIKRSIMRIERDCHYLSKYPNSNDKEKRRTELICAIEESQKNKYFNFSKAVLQDGGEYDHHRKSKSQVSHWKQKWNVSNYEANDPRWGSCVENNKNLSIMNCSLLMPYRVPTSLLLVGGESDSHDSSSTVVDLSVHLEIARTHTHT